ncbi:MAG TPA: glycosyltransferase family 2 protein [Verrucomicrobiae bacterium]
MQCEKQAKLGLIIPCYNEEEVLPKLLAGLEKMQEGTDMHLNILFIDDGSKDRTFELISEAALKNRSIACLRFSRNFGHQVAVAAGLRYVEGDVIGVLDADLQDPPEVMLKMVDKWAEGFDVVYGVRQNRKEGVMLRGAYALFYRLLKRVANVELPLDAGDFCVMDRRVVDCLKRMPEHAAFIRGLRGWVGFKQTGFPYDRAARAGGESKYGFSKLLNLAVQGLVSFSSVPLRLATWFGLFASAVGFCLMIWALVSALVLDKVPPGWASLAVMVLFFGGVQLLVMGIIGEYVGRIFDEVKNRPHFIIDSSVGWVVKPDVKL